MGEVTFAIVKLVLIALFGFYLYKRRFLDDKILRFLIVFVINFTVPFLIFSHLIENAHLVLKKPAARFILLSVIIFGTGFLLSVGASFKRHYEFKGEFISMVSFQNCGYLPMNIALFLFPPVLREEFLVYTFLYILGFNIIMWSVGSFYIFKRKGESFKFKSLFTPPITSIFFALLLIYTSGYKLFPPLILAPIKMIGDTSFVLSMLILGCWLAKVKLKGLSKNILFLGETALLKLIVLPLIFLGAVSALKIFSLLGMFIILQTAMPSAINLPIVVNLRGANSEFVSQGVFLTHIISIVTIPLWLGIFLKVSGFTF